MAKHYNKIQVARGDRGKKLPLLGELFYDYDSKSVFIGVAKSGTIPEGTHPYEWKRFGGFDSIVIKGTIGSDAEYAALNGHLLPGDAYIVTAPISVEQKEIIFDGEGNATRGKNYRTYDDFFKAGQIIVYCSEDLSSLPNAAVYGANASGAGFIPLSGGQNASDIENDVKFQPVAATAADPDDTAANATGLNNVQSALDYLFNNKMEYKGKFDTVNFTGTLTKTGNTTVEDTVINAIASMQALNPGEWIIYNGPTKSITVINGAAEETYILKKNTAIVMSATVVDSVNSETGNAEGGLDKIVSCFPLGAADANDIEFAFTDKRKSIEGTSEVKTKTVAGTATTLNPANSVDGQVDDQVTSVTQALDVLHQTKADLNAEGKIPLSQIPNTFVGALQYIGTVNLNGTTVTEMTAVQFAEAMAALNGTDSMEKPLEGEEANTQFQRVDAGDYVIVKVSGSTNVSDEAGTTSPRKSQIKVITGSGANDFFLVSEGDHVICNSVTYDDDGDITAVKLDHLDTSSRVDAVNGMTAEVDVVGNIRENVDISKTSTADLNNYPEVVVTNDLVTHQIKITIPNAVLAPSNIAKNAIPVGNGGKELLQSEVSINGIENDSLYHTDDPAHNTELVGKTAAGDEVVVEFPDASGKMAVTSEGEGTEDFIPKYDAYGNLIDSDVSQNTAAEKFDIYDKNGNKIVTINYNDLANLINFHRAGANNTTVEVVRRYDEVDATSGKKFTDIRNYDENTHTTLDDCSTIDGGEWV